MSGKSGNISAAMQSTDVSSMDETELNEILDKIIQNNIELVKKLERSSYNHSDGTRDERSKGQGFRKNGQ